MRVPLGIVSAMVVACSAATSRADRFLSGGDVSLLPFIESRGATFRDAGVAAPLDRILVERGANLFRLRLFVNPNPNYSSTAGAIQDLNSTIALAQRLKASGSKVLLDLHYSDTWADPGQQAIPAAWTGQSLASLQATVRDYTRDTLQAFRNAGVMPDLVQVGNEVTNGMLWPTGQVLYTGSTASQNQSWRNFGSLINSAIAGVRDVDELDAGRRTQVAVHIDGGSVEGRAAYFANKLHTTAQVAASSYEILGLSFYPSTTTALTSLQANLHHIATQTPLKAMVLEASHPWKGSATGSSWASTPAGQQAYFGAVRDAVASLPNGRGLGAIWWYPEAVQVPGTFIWKGGANALFDDSGGDGLPALTIFTPDASVWNGGADDSWAIPSNWIGPVPNAPSRAARFGNSASASRSVAIDENVTLGSIVFSSNEAYTLSGTGSLTIDELNASTRIDSLKGHHVIRVPLRAEDDLEINAAWMSTLTIDTQVDVSGNRLTKLGSGVVSIADVKAAVLTVDYGELRLQGSRASEVAGVMISAGGTLRVESSLVIDVESGDESAWLQRVKQWVTEDRLVTEESTAALIGYGPAAALSTTTFEGVGLDGTAVLIRSTIAGDANLDERIDFDDLLLLAQHYGTTSDAHWWQGDFNIDGAVAFDDLLSLAQRYGQSLTSTMDWWDMQSAVASDWKIAVSLVPEPFAASVAVGWTFCVLRRTRSR